MSEEAKKKTRKNRTTEVHKKNDPNKMRVEVKPGGGRNPYAEAAGSRNPTRGHKRRERGRAVERGYSRKPKHKGQRQYASATRVATMYLLSGKDKRHPGYSTFRRPGGQKHKGDPRPGARPRDTYDDKQHSTHTWIKVMRRMLNKGMAPDEVVNRLVRNHDVPRSMAKDYVYDASR